MKKIIFKIVFVLVIIILGVAIYKRGFTIRQMWTENPPTIRNSCWAICESDESVTWQEYVDRYHASKMKLDNPGGN